MGPRQASHAAVDGKHRGSKAGRTINTLLATRRLLIAAAVFFVSVLSGSTSHAQSGPFAGMGGNWHGGGTVTLDDGSTERIRCRASYDVAGPNMDMTLTCASDAYRFNLAGNVVAEGGAISGTWSEPGFNADLTLTTRGNRQSVVIRADTQFRGASMTLSR